MLILIIIMMMKYKFFNYINLYIIIIDKKFFKNLIK
jgi:hypothetical protein